MASSRGLRARGGSVSGRPRPLGAGRARREAGPGLRCRCMCLAAAASPVLPRRGGLCGPLARRLVWLLLRTGVFGFVPHLRSKIPINGLQRVG